MATDISYNGAVIGTLEPGKTATLACAGKKALGNIAVAFDSAGSITYNGSATEVEAGKTATLQCAGKKMMKDVFVTVPTPAISKPKISIFDDTLTITDESGLATSFDILVNGTAMMEVPAKHSAAEVTSGTSLTATIDCCVGETIVVAIVTRAALTVSDGWNLISTSNVNSADTTGQRLSWAWKVAESNTESITVTQASAQRLYINMVALFAGATIVDKGYSYVNNADGKSITVNKPSGLVLWGMSAPLWDTSSPYNTWEASNGISIIQFGTSSANRLGLGYDRTNATEVTFEAGANSTLIVGCLSVEEG